MSERATSRHSVGHVLLTISASLALAYTGWSCVFDDTVTVECESGLRCPSGFTCAVAQDVCIDDGCGDGVLDVGAGESCDDGNIIDNDGCTGDCRLENCGDGSLQDGETCDDGNEASGDGCSSDCLSDETCGNDYVDVGEICDDGNTIDGDGCRADCAGFEMCGNGTVDSGEQCDNGGTDDMVCDADCTFASCGDGYVNQQASETCDPNMGPDTDSMTCDGDCTEVVCGDGRANTAAGESCDTGGDSMTCDGDCSPVVCGDMYLNSQAGEGCDDGNLDVTDACPSGPMGNCQTATCGDGYTRTGIEECDTGGDSATCDGNCSFVVCGDGYINGAAGEQCDDSNANDNDACPSGMGTCQNARCGDGFIRVGVEFCDDMGESPTCDDDCSSVSCGDGNTNGAAGEQCDDGNTSDSDGCPSGAGTCQTAFCGDGYTYLGVEACDDAGDSLSCDANCTLAICGDNYINSMAGEMCDDGNTNDDDACVGACQDAFCGDGFIRNGVEICDPDMGLNVDSDSCDGDCTPVSCGDNYTNGAAGEACDDGNNDDEDFCLGDCSGLNVCGDGIHNMAMGGEACDDGGDSGSCDADCTLAECGDGYYNDQAETCDDTSGAGIDDGCDAATPNCNGGCTNCTN